MNIIHLISGLSRGGAEHMLYKLLTKADHSSFRSTVVSLVPGGVYAPRIEGLGVPVRDLGMTRGWLSPRGVARLNRLLVSERADVLHCWMYHANIVGAIAHRLVERKPRLIWSVRHSVRNIREERPKTRLVIRAGAFMSGTADKILFNSRVSLREHVELGFRSDNCEFIPNGFDLIQLKKDPAVRNRVRAQLKLQDRDTVVLHAARLHPMKDHQTLLDAAALLRNRGRFVFLLAGTGVASDNLLFTGCSDQQQRVQLLGERDDIPDLLNAADIACLSSRYGEGFPNFLGEAMAMSVPCVATDVGDTAYVIGDTGLVVPPRSPADLANAIALLAGEPPHEKVRRQLAARERVQQLFSLETIARVHERLYAQLRTA